MPKLTTTFQQEDIDNNKIIAALSYIWLLFLIPLITKKSRFAHFHAKQGLILFLLSFFTIIPIIGWLFSFVLLVVAIMAIVRTLSGEAWKIPYVYDLSNKIKI